MSANDRGIELAHARPDWRPLKGDSFDTTPTLPPQFNQSNTQTTSNAASRPPYLLSQSRSQQKQRETSFSAIPISKAMSVAGGKSTRGTAQNMVANDPVNSGGRDAIGEAPSSVPPPTSENRVQHPPSAPSGHVTSVRPPFPSIQHPSNAVSPKQLSKDDRIYSRDALFKNDRISINTDDNRQTPASRQPFEAHNLEGDETNKYHGASQISRPQTSLSQPSQKRNSMSQTKTSAATQPPISTTAELDTQPYPFRNTALDPSYPIVRGQISLGPGAFGASGRVSEPTYPRIPVHDPTEETKRQYRMEQPTEQGRVAKEAKSDSMPRTVPTAARILNTSFTQPFIPRHPNLPGLPTERQTQSNYPTSHKNAGVGIPETQVDRSHQKQPDDLRVPPAKTSKDPLRIVASHPVDTSPLVHTQSSIYRVGSPGSSERVLARSAGRARSMSASQIAEAYFQPSNSSRRPERSVANQVDILERELSRLENDNHELTRKTQLLRVEAETLQGHLDAAIINNEKVQGDCAKLREVTRNNKTTVEKFLKTHKDKMAEVQNKQEEVIKMLQGKVECGDKALEALRSDLDSLIKSCRSYFNAHGQLAISDGIQALLGQKGKVIQTINELKSHQDLLNAKLAAAEARCREVTEDRDDRRKQVEELTSRYDDLMVKVVKYEDRIEANTKQMESVLKSAPSAALITEWHDRLEEKQAALDRSRQTLTSKELEVVELNSKLESYEDSLTALGVKVDQLDGIIDTEEALNVVQLKEKLDSNDALWKARLEAAVKDLTNIAEIRTQLELDRVKQDLKSSRATLDHVNGAKISAETLTIQVSAELKAEVASLRRAESELKAQLEALRKEVAQRTAGENCAKIMVQEKDRTISDMKNKEKQYTAEIKQLSDDLENVRGQLEIAQRQKAKLQAKIKAVPQAAAIDTIGSQTDVDDRMEDLQMTVASLESEKAGKEQQCKSLTQQVKALEAEKITLQEKINSLEVSRDQRQETLASLAQSQSEVTRLQGLLEQALAEKAATIGKAEADRAAATVTIEELQQSVKNQGPGGQTEILRQRWDAQRITAEEEEVFKLVEEASKAPMVRQINKLENDLKKAGKEKTKAQTEAQKAAAQLDTAKEELDHLKKTRANIKNGSASLVAQGTSTEPQFTADREQSEIARLQQEVIRLTKKADKHMGQEKSFKTELEKVVKQKIEVEGLKRKLEIELSKRAEQDDKRRPEAQSFQGIENDLSPRKRELNRGECAREMDTELSSDELSPPPEFPLRQVPGSSHAHLSVPPTTPLNASTRASKSSSNNSPLKAASSSTAVELMNKKATTSMAKIYAPSKQAALNKQFKSPLPGSPSKTAVATPSSMGKKGAKTNCHPSKTLSPVDEDPIEPWISQYDLRGDEDDTTVTSTRACQGKSDLEGRPRGKGIGSSESEVPPMAATTREMNDLAVEKPAKKTRFAAAAPSSDGPEPYSNPAEDDPTDLWLNYPEEDQDESETPGTQQQARNHQELNMNLSQNPYPPSQYPRVKASNSGSTSAPLTRKASQAASASADSILPMSQTSVDSDVGSHADMVLSSQISSQATAGPGPSSQASKKRKRSTGAGKGRARTIDKDDADEDEYKPKATQGSKRGKKGKVTRL